MAGNFWQAGTGKFSGAPKWIGGWDKCRVLFVVMVERPVGHSSISTRRREA
jgi:hypothetical protein